MYRLIYVLMIPQASNGQEALPVTFRYEIGPLRSKTTHVYRPNTTERAQETVPANSMGACFASNYDKLPSSSRASVLWEVGLNTIGPFSIFPCSMFSGGLHRSPTEAANREAEALSYMQCAPTGQELVQAERVSCALSSAQAG